MIQQMKQQELNQKRLKKLSKSKLVELLSGAYYRLNAMQDIAVNIRNN